MQARKVNFVDLKKQYISIKEEIDNAIKDVIDNSSFILGPQVTEFEKNFAEFCQTKHCVGLSSGTEALHLALRALDIGPGDEVITAANTYIATALAISYAGAKPVLVDCSEQDYNIAISKIEEKITPKTKAIIPVHLYGQPVDYDRLRVIADKHSLYVIEDACQAHGATYKSQKTGSLGDIGCFSFYPGKNLGAYGDGGAITTDSEEIARKVRLLRDYGQEKKYHHTMKGFNSRLDSIQAAVVNAKLRHLDAWNKKRADNAGNYDEQLAKLDVITPKKMEYCEHVYHLYVVRVKARDEMLDYLKQNQVFCGIHYPIPIHLQEAYRELGYCKGDFPVAERLADEIISLPMFPELQEDDIHYVSEMIAGYSGEKPE